MPGEGTTDRPCVHGCRNPLSLSRTKVIASVGASATIGSLIGATPGPRVGLGRLLRLSPGKSRLRLTFEEASATEPLGSVAGV